MIINGDSLDELKKLAEDSVDLVCTDPPYGYSFMGKDWDKAVPSVEIWQECLRVLKPGAFCFVMSAPRSDVQNAMISRLMEAGFRLDFTPIYWTYASGFPKATNIAKALDKRAGVERDVIEERKVTENMAKMSKQSPNKAGYPKVERPKDNYWTGKILSKEAISPQAKALDGSYAGFQPKPAVEVIIVAMKPLSEKTYVDQALKNGKGITWLDDCRVPTTENVVVRQYDRTAEHGNQYGNGAANRPPNGIVTEGQGRFPANLLVSDEALNGHSKYFDLDAWADTLPFLAVPKASKSEKNKGLDGFEEKTGGTMKIGEGGGTMLTGSGNPRSTLRKNHHPTVKPLKLMSYLITLGSRPGDVVLDPFVGSGTTVVAAKQLGRNGVGIERETEYAEIAIARLAAAKTPEQQERDDPQRKLL